MLDSRCAKAFVRWRAVADPVKEQKIENNFCPCCVAKLQSLILSVYSRSFFGCWWKMERDLLYLLRHLSFVVFKPLMIWRKATERSEIKDKTEKKRSKKGDAKQHHKKMLFVEREWQNIIYLLRIFTKAAGAHPGEKCERLQNNSFVDTKCHIIMCFTATPHVCARDVYTCGHVSEVDIVNTNFDNK